MRYFDRFLIGENLTLDQVRAEISSLRNQEPVSDDPSGILQQAIRGFFERVRVRLRTGMTQAKETMHSILSKEEEAQEPVEVYYLLTSPSISEQLEIITSFELRKRRAYYDEETIIGISNDRSEMDEMVLGLTYFTMKTNQPGELKEYAIQNSGEELSI